MKDSIISTQNTEAAMQNRNVSDEAIGEVTTAYYLRQVAERLSVSLTRALKPYNTNSSAYRVLIALTRENPLGMRELGESTLLSPSTLSRTVEALRRDGCIRCEPDKNDARALIVHLEEQGQKQLTRILPAAAAQYEWAIRDIDPADLQVVHETLKKMMANLKTSPIK